MELQVGDIVERLASKNDYTNGRVGDVISIKDGRAQVKWLYTVDWDYREEGKRLYHTMNPINTWVQFKSLKKIDKYPT
jgi:hypothetical protein